jgi:hypothetical protein
MFITINQFAPVKKKNCDEMRLCLVRTSGRYYFSVALHMVKAMRELTLVFF